MFRKTLYLLIAILFIAFIIVLAKGLHKNPNLLPSALIDKPLPNFYLNDLFDENKFYDKDAVIGEVALINVWASWCFPCAAEHSMITEIAEQYRVPVFGLNYQDDRLDAQAWLEERGNPYRKIFYDEKGSTGIDWGIMAVPETFVIDAQGIVHYRHIGVLTLDVWNNNLLPIVHALQKKGSE